MESVLSFPPTPPPPPYRPDRSHAAVCPSIVLSISSSVASSVFPFISSHSFFFLPYFIPSFLPSFFLSLLPFPLLPGWTLNHPTICLSFCLSVCSSIYYSINQSTHLCVYLYISLSVHPLFHPFIDLLFLYSFLILCISRKYPYLPHKGILSQNPPIPWKFQFSFVNSLNVLLLKKCPHPNPPRNSNPFCGGGGIMDIYCNHIFFLSFFLGLIRPHNTSLHPGIHRH